MILSIMLLYHCCSDTFPCRKSLSYIFVHVKSRLETSLNSYRPNKLSHSRRNLSMAQVSVENMWTYCICLSFFFSFSPLVSSYFLPSPLSVQPLPPSFTEPTLSVVWERFTAYITLSSRAAAALFLSSSFICFHFLLLLLSFLLSFFLPPAFFPLVDLSLKCSSPLFFHHLFFVHIIFS